MKKITFRTLDDTQLELVNGGQLDTKAPSSKGSRGDIEMNAPTSEQEQPQSVL